MTNGLPQYAIGYWKIEEPELDGFYVAQLLRELASENPQHVEDFIGMSNLIDENRADRFGG